MVNQFILSIITLRVIFFDSIQDNEKEKERKRKRVNTSNEKLIQKKIK